MIEKILEYQKTEAEIIKLENELLGSKDREKASEIQVLLKKQHSRLVTLENIAQKANASYKKATEKYADYMKKLEALEKELETADESKIALYEKAYKDFFAVANALEKEIAAMYAEVQQTNREYEEIINKSKTDRARFDKFKAAYGKLKAEIEPKIAALKESQEKMKKQIDEKLYALYQQKRESKKFPVFVALVDKKCGGCRMEISASKLNSMKSNNYGLIECENCGRFIYQK